MKQKVALFLSHVAVAAITCIVTLAIVWAPADAPISYSKLDELQRIIDYFFIGQVDEDTMADALVTGLGDRWSYYMTAEEYADHLDALANTYVGIGVAVQVDKEDRGIVITQVIAGGSAEEAGVLPGDIITAVDDHGIAGASLSEVNPLLKGEEGSLVKLRLLRGEQTLELTIQRRKIKTVVATGVLLGGNIGLVKIDNFDDRCFEETVAVIEDLRSQGAQALIFDVRYNPGGYKRELVKLLDYLLPEGLLFHSEYYDGSTQKDWSDAACLDMPMAVLINGSSYSAAEFFAAALDEYDRAVTVGSQTSGKGYFQTSIQLTDGSAVNLSVGKYYTPKGVSLAEVGGLVPEIPVEVTNEEAFAIYAGTIDPMKDPQVLAAIAALTD